MSLRQHRPILAIALKLLSVNLFAAMAVSVRYLSKTIPAGEMIFARSAIGVAALVLVAWHMRELRWLTTRNWRAHLRRATCGTLGMFALFMALGRVPVADVTAISFMAPIFVTVLAIPFLRERIDAYRWTAIAMGFCGVLIMVAPRMSLADSESLGLAFALVSAFGMALAAIFVRGMSDAEHPITITFYFTLASLIGGACTLPWGWPVPSATEWLLLLLVGVLGIGGQFLMAAALRYAEASIIAPLDYTSVITATLLGYFLFGELPGVSIWTGVPLVIAAGLLILWREYQKTGRDRAPGLQIE